MGFVDTLGHCVLKQNQKCTRKVLLPRNDYMDGAKVLLVLFFIARAPFVVCLAIDRPHFSEIVSLALQEQLHTYFSINEARK